jgi:hypothetical protein
MGLKRCGSHNHAIPVSGDIEPLLGAVVAGLDPATYRDKALFAKLMDTRVKPAYDVQPIRNTLPWTRTSIPQP